MKKLLSILTITTLTASIPTPLLANTTLTRTKRDIGTMEKNVTSGFDIKIKDIVKEIYADDKSLGILNSRTNIFAVV